VILSTHIVQEVANLCPRTAMLVGGKIVRVGAPLDLIGELRGRIWQKVIDKRELAAHRAAHEIIATRLSSGRTVIHVLADHQPGPGFATAEGSLEDVYFSTLSSLRRAA
jgi:ABC-type multidrug transport system ATPase subunit